MEIFNRRRKETLTRKNAEWIQERGFLIDTIQTFTKGDRQQILTQISFIHNAMTESLMFWGQWINNWLGNELYKKINKNLKEFEPLTDKELWKLHEKYKDVALQFILLDIEMTNFVNKKVSKKMRKFYEEDTKDKQSGMIV